MDRLRTTPAHLKAQASKLKAQGDKIGNTVEEIINAVESISATVWSGEAATAYKNQIEELSDDARRMETLLNETSDKLNMIADTYADAEEMNTSVAHSLPTDIF